MLALVGLKYDSYSDELKIASTFILLNLQRWPEKFDDFGRPYASYQALSDLDERFSVPLHSSDHNHYQVRVGKQLGGVCNSIVDFFRSVKIINYF